jgi:glycosyltransferase involved in cell wall biosynthesis
VLAADVVFNREVMGTTARFFATRADLAALIQIAETQPGEMKAMGLEGQERVCRRYNWDEVAEGYEDLCYRLIERQQLVSKPSGPSRQLRRR